MMPFWDQSKKGLMNVIKPFLLLMSFAKIIFLIGRMVAIYYS